MKNILVVIGSGRANGNTMHNFPVRPFSRAAALPSGCTQPVRGGTSAAGGETFLSLSAGIECAVVSLDKKHIGLEG
ncbi:hypothetical protein EAI89_11585 [Eubacterium sp. am_0171]|uniref:Uncharacterized protein n=1 Tax=Faecalicatena contorta TaxID=39482 RepID=A0A174EMI1_9FIRM|nr:hypothetical protein EAI89_11585 [Eubacterium sp. am_0171]CUO38447.1 Uncharacterised protein [[Eubacterium] contortum] [Faecalicatena contorta]